MSSLIHLQRIDKRFGGIAALQGAELSIQPGEVHAVVGENGAGKSTLMGILSGKLAPDGGKILLDGEPVRFGGPRDALKRGIAIIHQELMLVPDLSVSENIFLSNLPRIGSQRVLRDRAAEIIRQLGFDIDPAAQVGELVVAQQQIVEVAKALSLDARVLIFDEPTAVLGNRDAQRLLGIIEDLRAKGTAIVYISHRLDEVLQIADRITVLKDGRTVTTVKSEETTIDGLIRLMVGRQISTLFGEARSRHIGAEVLRAEGLRAGHLVAGVDFALRAGEIVGLGGLVGSGRTETARLLFGADRLESGRIIVDGTPVRIRHPADAIAAGIGLVPEDRKQQGVVVEDSIRSNLTMAGLTRFTTAGILRRGLERKAVDQKVRDLGIKVPGIDAPVSALSGGNQQKVVIGKWFDVASKIVLLDEPTRGVDVGAKAGLYTLIRRLAEQGRAILVISSDHQELFGLCDRVLVMGRGKITAELLPPDYSEEKLIASSLAIDTPQQMDHSHAA